MSPKRSQITFSGLVHTIEKYAECEVLKQLAIIHEDLNDELKEVTSKKIDLEAQTRILASVIEFYLE